MRKILSILFLFFAVQLSAQTKTFSISDCVLNRNMQPKSIRQLGWVGKSENYCYVDTVAGGKDVLYMKSVVGNTSHTIPLETINSSLKKLGEDELKNFPSITWAGSNTFFFAGKNRIFSYSFPDGDLPYEVDFKAVNTFSKDAEALDIEPKTQSAAFVSENNLYVSKNNLVKQVTQNGSTDLVYGKSVHRDEFGISKGTFWSPQGNLLAFYRMDQTNVTDYPIVDISEQPAKDNPIKYPMAGGVSHNVLIGIYNYAKNTTNYLQTQQVEGEPDEHYLTNISWSPDEKYIYVFELNRGQNDMKLNQYETNSGAFIQTIFEEKSPTYVEPMVPLQFVPNHPDQFVWQSEKDGFTHLYLFDREGTQLRQLTKGNWVVTGFLGFNPEGTLAFYTANTVSPLNNDVYSVNLKSGKITWLTASNVNGTNSAILNENGKYLIINFSSTTVPKRISIIDKTGKQMKSLLDAPNPLKDYKTGQLKLFTIKAADGKTDLYCRMILPTDFDSTKKYPSLTYVYNGPNVQLVKNTWLGGADLWQHYMATQGFVVFTVDGRGSANRGHAFETATFRNLGTVEMADQLMGAKYLKSKRYIDSTRMGINGWSYGGFMTTTMMLRAPGTYKVGACGGPVIDWRYYEIMYTERYMDTPDENPEGYDKACLLNYVKNLKGKLLLIHGCVDDVVVWQHSLMFVKKCVDEGVQLDYFVYPGHPHNVRGKDRVHLLTKFTDYYKGNL